MSEPREPMIIISHQQGGRDYTKRPKIQTVPEDSGREKLYEGLTAKMENFCRHVANGETVPAAYRLSYGVSPDSDPNNVYKKAHMLFKRPDIKQRIDHLLNEREHIAINDYAEIRRFVVERLQVEAMNAQSDASRIRALELLGKIDKVQLFNDKPVEEEKLSHRKDLTKELESRLTRLLASRTVEVKSTKQQ
jgi:hypothetical protein